MVLKRDSGINFNKIFLTMNNKVLYHTVFNRTGSLFIQVN